MRKKKKSKAQIIRDWGMGDYRSSNLRYKTPIEKGIYWYWFSLHVRQRDVEQYGTCISCNKPITVDTCDAGHYIPASSCGRDLLFDPLNVPAECSRCNAFDEGHLFGYEKGLIERYGEETVNNLKDRYFEYKNGGVLKDFKGSEYAEKIKQLSSYQRHMKNNAEQCDIL